MHVKLYDFWEVDFALVWFRWTSEAFLDDVWFTNCSPWPDMV